MIRSILILAAALIVVGCSRREQGLGPPDVPYGQTDCSQCGMSVSDEHYAAAAIVEIPDGGRVARVFDDIGCLFAYEREQHEGKVLARYVKDYWTHQWVPAGEAFYVRGKAIQSPMGYGLLATAKAESAAALAKDKAGQAVDLKAVQAAGATQLSSR